MEFPDLGKRCSDTSCNMFDFLPYTCVYCHDTFCQDHFKLQAHHCPSLKDPKYDIRVPVCSLCDKPVPISRGQDPNIRMSLHIASNCSDIKPKTNNTCRKKGCKTKLLVPMHCSDCGLSFCVSHRFAVDHSCSHNKQNTKNTNLVKKNQQEAIIRLQNKVKLGKITDNEQLQLAKLLSLNEKDRGITVY